MQPDFERTAAAMVDGTNKAIQAAIAPLLKRIEALEARPAPERGEKGDRGAPGNDGVGLAGALIDRTGVLVLTLTDGSTRDLGVVVGKDGESADLEAVSAEIDEKVTKAVAALPPPERGEPGPAGADGAPGEKGERGADGCGIMDLMIDADGQLVASLDDGRFKSLGNIKGADGKDGRDGFSLDDFDCEPVDERTIKLMFTRGEVCHSYELEFPVIIDRGVYKEDQTYVRGDAVTWGGSLWIAQKETSAKPDSPESGFRLAVKKGRDGKDAK